MKISQSFLKKIKQTESDEIILTPEEDITNSFYKDEDAIKRLCNTLLENNNIKKIVIKNFNLTYKQINVLLNNLKRTNFTDIAIENCNLENGHIKIIGDLIESNRYLRTLSLKNNSITALTSDLQNILKKVMTTIDFSWNPIISIPPQLEIITKYISFDLMDNFTYSFFLMCDAAQNKEIEFAYQDFMTHLKKNNIYFQEQFTTLIKNKKFELALNHIKDRSDSIPPIIFITFSSILNAQLKNYQITLFTGESMLSYEKTFSVIYFNLAQAHFYMNNFSKADENIKLAIEHRSDFKGAKLLQEIIQKNIKPPINSFTNVDYFNTALQHQQNGETEEAIVAFKKYILSPANSQTQKDYYATALYQLGILTKSQGNYAISKGYFLEYLKLNNKNYHAHYQLGVLEYNLGNIYDAIDKFQTIISLTLDKNLLSKVYTTLAQCYNTINQSIDAQTFASAAISIQNDFAPAHFEIGIAYLQLGQPFIAAQAFETVITLDPNNIDAYFYFAQALDNPQTMPLEIIENYNFFIKKTFSNHPNLIQAYYRIADIYYQLQYYEDSEVYIKMCIESAPSNPNFYFYLADIKIQQRLYHEALNQIKEALPWANEPHSLCMLYEKAVFLVTFLSHLPEFNKALQKIFSDLSWSFGKLSYGEYAKHCSNYFAQLSSKPKNQAKSQPSNWGPYSFLMHMNENSENEEEIIDDDNKKAYYFLPNNLFGQTE